MNLNHNKLMIQRPKLITLISVFLILPFFQTVPVYADDLTISGNGSDSNSKVNISISNTKEISQSNNAAVSNEVKPQVTTGSNSVNGNTTDSSSVNTGVAKSDINIKNSANSSVVNTDCCSSSADTSVKILHNGQGSTNTALLNAPTSTNIAVTQNASITNTVSGSANTGNNSASGNNGNVAIRTGNVIVTEKIVNQNINFSFIEVPQGGENISIKIAGNGQDSVNIVSADDAISHNVVVLNAVRLRNTLDFYANSGGNLADSNLGTVSITTGDVLIDTFVKNADINFSKVVFNCCTTTTNSPPPPPTGGGGNGGSSGGGGSNNTTNNTSSNSTNSSSATTPGQGGGPGILGAAAMMPATGSSWAIWLSLLAGIMFAMGLHLRFHPGQDPGKNFRGLIMYQNWLI